MASVWQEWHISLGTENSATLQRDLILDLLKPTIALLSGQIDRFHFFRYFRRYEDIATSWGGWSGVQEVLSALGEASHISYVTFRVRTLESCAKGTAELVERAIRSYQPRVLAVRRPDQPESLREGLETYGGNDVHPMQHEFFHHISLTSLHLLELERQGKLTLNGTVCTTADVADQWSHMILNQLNIWECLVGYEAPDGSTTSTVVGPSGYPRQLLIYDTIVNP